MSEKVLEGIVGFGKLQIGFWILVYEVIIYMFKSKLRPFFKSRLEQCIQLWPNLEIKARHNKGEEPKIRISQNLSNASVFELKIKRIDASLKVKGAEIERFHYDESDNIFLDKDKLFFPKKGRIPPLDLYDKVIVYRITEIEKITRIDSDFKKHAMLLKIDQAIDFASKSTVITKTVEEKPATIQPEDWKGGGQ